MTFYGDMSREEIARIQEIIFKYPAFSIVERPAKKMRSIYFGNLWDTLIKTKLHKRDSLYYLPGDIAGITGVERSYEKKEAKKE